MQARCPLPPDLVVARRGWMQEANQPHNASCLSCLLRASRHTLVGSQFLSPGAGRPCDKIGPGARRLVMWCSMWLGKRWRVDSSVWLPLVWPVGCLPKSQDSIRSGARTPPPRCTHTSIQAAVLMRITWSLQIATLQIIKTFSTDGICCEWGLVFLALEVSVPSPS